PGMKGGIEYPAIAVLSAVKSQQITERIIVHEVGRNWFYGILASNEREYPWMGEGMNTLYRKRYFDSHRKTTSIKFDPSCVGRGPFEAVAAVKKDQPVNLPAAAFSPANYYLSAYCKASKWLEVLQTSLAKPLFDSCMRAYYDQW